MHSTPSDVGVIVAGTMRTILFKTSLATVVLFAIGCGGSESNDNDASVLVPMPIDAGFDADLRDADRPPLDDAGALAFGPGIILDEVHFATEGHSWAGWAPLVNPQFDVAIENADMILLVEFRGLDDPSGQNDNDVSVAIYAGVDTDGISSNNFSGQATIQVSELSLDSIGNPRALLPNATITSGHLTGTIQGEIVIFLPSIGAVRVQDPTFSGDLVASSDNESIVELQNATLFGSMLARHLEAVHNPVPATCLAQSMLDLVALPCLAFDGVQPDVDRDNDGLEKFEENKDFINGTIDTCTDGNGQTYASTPMIQCVLDPAFQDAFTAKLETRGVRAFLQPPPSF